MMNIKHFFSLLISLSLLGSALFVPAHGAQAADTHPVIDLRTTPSGGNDILDPNTCSLRQAILAINNHSNYDACVADNTTTTIILPNEMIGLTVTNTVGDPNTTGDLNITASMNIIGSGPYSGVSWPDSGRLDRVFHIGGGAVVRMSGFTISNGKAQISATDLDGDGGGILNMGSALTLTNMTLDNNDAAGGGGAIASFNYGSSLTLNAVNITNNTSAAGSGGIYSQGSLRVENSYFYKNTSYITSTTKFATLNYANRTSNVAGVINNSTFSENTGYGISNANYGNLILSYLTMVGNTESALYLNSTTWTYLRDSIILSTTGGDCYNNGASFVDGGYNIVFPKPSGSNTCAYNNGDLNDDSTYHTRFEDPGLTVPAAKIGDNYTSVYSFAPTSLVYNYHAIDEPSGICISPALPAGVTPPGGIVIPSLPGYDQYLGPRPTYLESDAPKGCDVGAYESGAYLVKPHIYLPTLRKFN